MKNIHVTHKPTQMPINFGEMAIDNFAGGGGWSEGFYQATGKHVDVAINHDAEALAMHAINHPHTMHLCESVWDVNPREVTRGRPVGAVHLSPDCKHFSKAKGGKPVEKNIRGLAWVGVRWAAVTKARLITLENVGEFVTWGPLVSDGKGNFIPNPTRKGHTFKSFCRALERLGYVVEHRELRACDYGAPTIRKRLFLIARCDGLPIVWPEVTHGDPKGDAVKSGKLLPWKTAADCIDFSLPCPSIFERKKPLAENTLRRIAKGIQRYVIDCEKPFIVSSIVPFITEHANASNQRNMDANSPLRTQCAQVKGGHFALVSALIAKHYTGVVGSPVSDPLHTVTSVDHNSLVTTNLVTLRNNAIGQGVDEPLRTITSSGSHHAEVRAFLIKYYGTDGAQLVDEPLHTITTKERFGLVIVEGVEYAIVDIGMRMMQPRELFTAQGFDDNYIIGDDAEQGLKLTKTAQVRMCGNSVPPHFAKALVSANYVSQLVTEPMEAAA